MNALEIRILAYATLVVLLLGAGAYTAHRLTRLHYEAKIADMERSQSDALVLAQSRNITLQNQRLEERDKAVSEYDALKKSYAPLLFNYQRLLYDSLHPKPVPAAPGATAGADGAVASPTSDPKIAGAERETLAACIHDTPIAVGLQTYIGSLK